MSIIKTNLVPFLLQVGVPLIIALGAILAVYAGVVNLKNQIATEQDLIQKAEKINHAFKKIGDQEEALSGQRSELEKQREITTNLHLEYTKQKEFNQLLNQIQVLSLGAQNGSRKDFEAFYSLVKERKLNPELQHIWDQKYSNLKKMWEGELEKINLYRLFYKANTNETRKWSQEYLYFGISSIWQNRSWAYNNKDYIAYFKEIEVSKSKYFIETLYEIATDGSNISYSILAAKTLCEITNFEPYSGPRFVNPHKHLLDDIPQFKQMKEWWAKSGSKNEKYKCPFKTIVENHRNYYSYDREALGENNKRLEFLTKIISNYPNLYRTKAEIAYIKLGEPSTYAEVEQLAKEAIAGTNMEPLPYLLLSFIGLKQSDNNKMEKNLKLAENSFGQENMITTITINPKLHELMRHIRK